MFRNLKRRYGYANRLSPITFEKQQFNKLEGASESRGES